MSGDLWASSLHAAEYLGVNEKNLAILREKGFLKPGLHWKSAPFEQLRPWCPEAVYNLELCKKAIHNSLTINESENYAA